MISVCDAFTGQYGSWKAFIDSLIGTLALEMRERGWKGAHLVDAQWRKHKDGSPDQVVICVGPGQSPLTIDQVRKFIKDNRGK